MKRDCVTTTSVILLPFDPSRYIHATLAKHKTFGLLKASKDLPISQRADEKFSAPKLFSCPTVHQFESRNERVGEKKERGSFASVI